MSEKPDELKKLVAVATDMALAPRLRVQAIELIAQIGTHEALLALLDLVAREQLTRGERELALKRAQKIVRSEH